MNDENLFKLFQLVIKYCVKDVAPSFCGWHFKTFSRLLTELPGTCNIGFWSFITCLLVSWLRIFLPYLRCKFMETNVQDWDLVTQNTNKWLHCLMVRGKSTLNTQSNGPLRTFWIEEIRVFERPMISVVYLFTNGMRSTSKVVLCCVMLQ